MIISLSPLRSMTDSLTSMLVMSIRHTPSLDLSSLFSQCRQTFPAAAIRCFVVPDRTRSGQR